MKKIIYSLSAILSAFTLNAQTVLNGSFENWTNITYDFPTGYSNSNGEAYFKCTSPFNIVKTTDFYNGNFAVQLTTVANGNDTCMAYMLSAPQPNGSGNSPCQWPGGIPYTQIPTGIKGYYKSNTTAPDSGGILVAFKNNFVCQGMYLFKLGGVHSTYTPFSFTFNPPLLGAPDTMIFGAVSSDIFNNIAIPGSMLQLDSVSLIGVTQPAAMNGDFENWSNQTIYSPDNWYTMVSSEGVGVNQTTDKTNGQYAVEMVTRLGDNNGIPRASFGGVSNGYYLNNCGGSNCQVGGMPFTAAVDTLCFYYKYAPMGSDTALVNLNFKKNGSNVNYQNAWYNTPVASYQFAEVPISNGMSTDSVIISFQSSTYNDTAVTFVGSTFKVDDVFFKSQGSSMGISYFKNAPANIYPNPAFDGNFVIDNIGKHDLVRVMNVYGQEVNARVIKSNNKAKVHVDSPGAYMVYINAMGKISNHKVIVGKE